MGYIFLDATGFLVNIDAKHLILNILSYILLSNVADPNSVDCFGSTALIHSTTNGSLYLVEVTL